MPFWRSGRRIVYNTAKRPVAVYAGDQPIARYHYNSQDERIAKTTVFAPRAPLTAVSYAHAQAQGKTTYTLYRDQRLAAETDSEGQITAPQQVFDGRQRLIWQADTGAYGQARLTFAAASGANGWRFVMNLRLPGQIFDAETGLHYNYLRDYDPSLGRYMTPDPLGLDGGEYLHAFEDTFSHRNRDNIPYDALQLGAGAANAIRNSTIEVTNGHAGIYLFGPNQVIENNIIIFKGKSLFESAAALKLHQADGSIIRNNDIIIESTGDDAPKAAISLIDSKGVIAENPACIKRVGAGRAPTSSRTDNVRPSPPTACARHSVRLCIQRRKCMLLLGKKIIVLKIP